MTTNSISEINHKSPESVWKKTAVLPGFEHLKTDKKTDVLIIGGGMAGILCAYLLDQAGVDYILAEADTIGSGITKNTTAKITSQHGLIYHKLIKQSGIEKAAAYLQINQDAVEKYRKLCAKIDCDFEEKDAFVYSRDNPLVIADEMDALRKLNFPAEYAAQLPLPFPVAGAVRFAGQAQFHPFKFLSAIAKGLNIYEHTMVKELAGCKAYTPDGTITAGKIIVATHFPFLNKHGSYFLKMYQHRSYVIALKHAPELMPKSASENVPAFMPALNGMYVDDSRTGLSFRTYQNLLLLGGSGHRTGKPGGNWEELRRFAAQYYPHARECCHWSTQDCMTLDDIPYIGRYSKNTPDLYVATGFNKWGMTSSMVSAMLLTDLVIGKENPYAPVFSPSRSILQPQLAVNALEAAKNLLTISSPRCPHMGCALKWNQTEHSWDCPCHGSRFAEDGQVIDNPATGGLR